MSILYIELVQYNQIITQYILCEIFFVCASKMHPWVCHTDSRAWLAQVAKTTLRRLIQQRSTSSRQPLCSWLCSLLGSPRRRIRSPGTSLQDGDGRPPTAINDDLGWHPLPRSPLLQTHCRSKLLATWSLGRGLKLQPWSYSISKGFSKAGILRAINGL